MTTNYIKCNINNDGCAIARSNEAKALGIKMGQPLFQIRDIVRRHNVVVKSSNYALYGDISQRVMTTIADSAPESTIYSIDEIFVDLDRMAINHSEWARELKYKILRETGIPVGIGISLTKTLAKVANKLAKQSSKADGCLVLNTPKWIDLALERTATKDVWGIGRQLSRKLASIGVTTAKQLRDMPDRNARNMMTVVGLKTVLELRGLRCIDFDDSPEQRETVCVSRSFGKEVTDVETLKEALLTFAARACKKLRRFDLVAGRFQIYVLSNSFKPNQPQFSKGRDVGLVPHTNDTRILSKSISQNLDRIWRDGMSVKKAGILMMDLCPSSKVPQDLLMPLYTTDNPLMAALDQIENRFGKETVTIGRLANQQKPDWYMTASNRSPCYTTRWTDIPSVK
ncbi:MAG: Y-family DNA polymerase [Thalassospira sp.]|uniref:Y-family DNA polymerase n=1 Tax=Thalassospira sp. TaxID=1912094 RepID=UPI0032ED4023